MSVPDPRLPIIPLEFSGRSRYLAAQLAGNLLRTIADNLPAKLADNLLRTIAGILSAQQPALSLHNSRQVLCTIADNNLPAQ